LPRQVHVFYGIRGHEKGSTTQQEAHHAVHDSHAAKETPSIHNDKTGHH
jgi:hypothetical protein